MKKERNILFYEEKNDKTVKKKVWSYHNILRIKLWFRNKKKYFDVKIK